MGETDFGQRRQVGVPYAGDDPFLFVSYLRRDAELVAKDIRLLQSAGYRLWWDVAIAIGTDWSEQIAQRVERCIGVLAFLTGDAVESRHVRDEIIFALEVQKPLYPIYVAQVTLPPALSFRIGTIQAIHRYRLDDDQFVETLNRAVSMSARISADAMKVNEIVILLIDLISDPTQPSTGSLDCMSLTYSDGRLCARYETDLTPGEAWDFTNRGWHIWCGEHGIERVFDIPPMTNPRRLRDIAASLLFAVKALNSGSSVWNYEVRRQGSSNPQIDS